MKILVLSSIEWSVQNATGNTYSNWFGGKIWAQDTFSNFYMRSSLPDNDICEDYYRVTPQSMLKNLFHPSVLGKHVRITREIQLKTEKSDSSNAEKAQIAKLHQKPSQIIYGGMEWLCRHQGWNNKNLQNYLEEFDPDIVFTSLANNGMWKPMMETIRKYTHAKIVMYASDDIYGDAKKKAWFRRRHLVPEYEWCIRNADKLYGASEEICKAYEQEFGCQLTPLYKGCEFTPLIKKFNQPLRFVYAGNLLYGRSDTLGALAKALSAVNEDGQKAVLEIYTGTAITDELRDRLNIPGSSQIMGQRPYEEIKKILSESDVVLHVESFEQEQIDYVHYSFSTKIIDCLQSGSIPFAIGPAGIASVEYMRRIPGAVVVDDLDRLEYTLRDILDHGEKLAQIPAEVRAFAIEHHDIETVQKKLHHDFEELLA